MPVPCAPRARASLAALLLAAALFAGCGVIPFTDRPAAGYTYGSGAPLRVAVIDDAGAAWAPAVDAGVAAYGGATPYLRFQPSPGGANIVVTVHAYTDAQPPPVRGYLYPWGAGGFTLVYDAAGAACNYPPATVPLNCTGEIATADVYLNDAIPPGTDLEARRERLVLHELGHALGLTRHSPALEIAALAGRYGWPR